MNAAAQHYDVVIIGGAVTGGSIAWFLSSRRDFDGRIAVIERDPTYQFASTSLSLSSVRRQFSTPVNIKMSMFAAEFIAKCKENFGEAAPDLQFKQHGYLFLATQKTAHILRENHAVQTECGARTLLLSRDELAAKFAWLHCDDIVLGAWGEVGEGWFDGVAMMHALHRGAKANGVEYLRDEAVGLEVRDARVAAVKLKSGATLLCDELVNAAGTRAAQVAAYAGVALPVEPHKRTVFVFRTRDPAPPDMPLLIDESGIHCRPEGATFVCGGAAEPHACAAIDDFTMQHEQFDEKIWPTLAHRAKLFETLKVTGGWAGHYAYNTFDQNAVIGRHPEIHNFIFANGFSGHGLQHSPAVGRGVSELIACGAYQSLDLNALGFERILQNRKMVENAVL